MALMMPSSLVPRSESEMLAQHLRERDVARLCNVRGSAVRTGVDEAVDVDADEQARAGVVGDIVAGLELLMRGVVGLIDVHVGIARHAHLPAARNQDVAQTLGHIEREAGFGHPGARGADVAATITGVDHDEARIPRHVVRAAAPGPELPRRITGLIAAERRGRCAVLSGRDDEPMLPCLHGRHGRSLRGQRRCSGRLPTEKRRAAFGRQAKSRRAPCPDRPGERVPKSADRVVLIDRRTAELGSGNIHPKAIVGSRRRCHV